MNTFREASSALILTSTLRPSSSVYELKRANWALREQDYLFAIERWKKSPQGPWNHMWLVDNSPDISPDDWSELGSKLKRRSGGLIEPVKVQPRVDPDSEPVQKGRGEADLLDAAVLELADRGFEEFTKVTGRLFVSNVGQVFEASRTGGISACISSSLSFADTRLFKMPVKVWLDHYQGMASEVDETKNIFFEHAFSRRTLTAVAAGVPFHGVRRLPRFVGSSGSMNIDYGSVRTRLRQVGHELRRAPIRFKAVIL